MRFFKSRRLRSEITVFLALTLTLTFALVLAVIESARTEAGRLYFTKTANSAIDSLFSQYHEDLWDEYRILGLEHYSSKQIEDEMDQFMKPYLSIKNVYPMQIENTEVKDMNLITSDNGAVFEKEILDYMKYGIAAKIWDIAEIEEFLACVKSGEAVDRTALDYMNHEKEAMKIEQCLEAIKECLNRQDSAYQSACNKALNQNCQGFVSEARKIRTEMTKLPSLVEKYEKAADALNKALVESRKKFEAEKGNIAKEDADLIEREISEYENYILEDGKRRTQIRGFGSRAENNKRFIDGEIEEAYDLKEYIDDYYDDEDHGYLNTRALWRQFERGFECYDKITIPVQIGIEDKEKENALNNVKALLEGKLLKLVLPEDALLSTETIDFSDSPSEKYAENTVDSASVEDRVFIAEYLADVCDYFGRGVYEKGSTVTGSGHNELEYILFGKSNDTENLSEAVKDLVSLRTGANLCYLLKDNEKRNEARTLAAAVTGVTGFTPIITVMTFFILSTWALGQALCDVRDMLAGEKVPLIHSRSSFYLSLEGLLNIGRGNQPEHRSRNESGLLYVDYLKIFIFVRHSSVFDYRAMDVIQMFLRKRQGDFRMDRMITSLDMGVRVKTRHIFTEQALVKNLFPSSLTSYEMNVETSYAY